MRKSELISKIQEAGDAIVTYRSRNSRKLKYNVVTLNFDTPYIRTKRNFSKETSDEVLTFCWDKDAFRLLDARYILTVQPLAQVLKNAG